MRQPSPADQSPKGANPAAAPVLEPGFEAAIHAFWVRNRNTVLLACVAALLVIIGREGWQYYAAMHEQAVQEEYARIADRTDKLAAFAEGNAGHSLAGVAYLRLADEKYSAGDYKEAAANYQKAAANLKNEALLGRARLGAAVSVLSGGDKVAGEAALKAVGADQSLLKSIRAEATYHLASVTFEAGKVEEAKKLVDEVGKVDPTGTWYQRAMMLLTSEPAGSAPAVVVPPTVSFKPSGG